MAKFEHRIRFPWCIVFPVFVALHLNGIDLNYPSIGASDVFETCSSGSQAAKFSISVQSTGRKRKRNNVIDDSDSKLYEGVVCSKGSIVKESGQVLRLRKMSRERRPNVICRVETFGRICSSFDDCRKQWVKEMGFGGLLNLVDMHLPRPLCYWLMTRVDPVNEMLSVCDKKYRLSSNQIRWVLGIPKVARRVPCSFERETDRSLVFGFESKFGQVWTNFDVSKGKEVTRQALSVNPIVVERLMSKFESIEVVEFKILFMLASLELVLCPTQCSRFPKDLLPALGCALDARCYDWCGFVLKKLMASVKRFARSFYREGFASGCGGCTLFLAVFYLDRLDRNALNWGCFPRIRVWKDPDIRDACDADRGYADGDFGSLGVLDVAYGEQHPRDARDTEVNSDDEYVPL